MIEITCVNCKEKLTKQGTMIINAPVANHSNIAHLCGRCNNLLCDIMEKGLKEVVTMIKRKPTTDVAEETFTRDQVETMLSHMQQYNGRSIEECIKKGLEE